MSTMNLEFVLEMIFIKTILKLRILIIMILIKIIFQLKFKHAKKRMILNAKTKVKYNTF